MRQSKSLLTWIHIFFYWISGFCLLTTMDLMRNLEYSVRIFLRMASMGWLRSLLMRSWINRGNLSKGCFGSSSSRSGLVVGSTSWTPRTPGLCSWRCQCSRMIECRIPSFSFRRYSICFSACFAALLSKSAVFLLIGSPYLLFYYCHFCQIYLVVV